MVVEGSMRGLSMTRLSVNVNKVALLRNTRTIGIPSVTRAADICLKAGAHGITVHPRPDQRHIRPDDVRDLTGFLRKHYRQAEFNIEGNPFEGDYVAIVRDAKPDQCTLVPDSVEAATSDHGWDVRANLPRLKPLIQELKSLGCRVSLFMDADPERIALAAEAGADRVELYTEPYARAYAAGKPDPVVERFRTAAEKAQAAGLGLNAGHDLNVRNLGRFLTIPGILEVSIGHALIAEALEIGLANAVKAYLRVLAAK
jgi:pyridoxine 5-phosphate synthase